MATLTNIETGDTKEAPAGYSWTTLLFGPIPAFMRGDIFWGGIMLATDIVTGGLTWLLVWPFLYNGLYYKRLTDAGYKPGRATQKLVNPDVVKAAEAPPPPPTPAAERTRFMPAGSFTPPTPTQKD
ncbi:hypothetical protein [Sphingomonas crocodyli]|uniref:DUF2628 domain-containing protein n=1 Tax=Sphingomonas crocodyli TaxID=1979270 RepID=A0A437LUQ0_9SPHN|nr:hypothetical protein [Sphingomonas crocodyli]RVT89106.1 hypothetical protein EOD43_22555 [Sphingomonas crocodyli]